MVLMQKNVLVLRRQTLKCRVKHYESVAYFQVAQPLERHFILERGAGQVYGPKC